MHTQFAVGQRVRARVDLINDQREHGLGVELCAGKGEELVVRNVDGALRYSVVVSHEHVLDRTFSVAPDEIEPA